MSRMSNRAVLRGACAFAALVMASPAAADVIVGPRFSYYFDNSNLRTSNLTAFDDALLQRDQQIEQLLDEALEDASPTVLREAPSTSVLADQMGFAMYGGIINFGDDRDRFTFSALYGEGKGTTRVSSQSSITALLIAGLTIADLEVSNVVTDTDVSRLDLEATWQRRLNENFAITAGLRYERLEATAFGLETVTSTDQILSFAFDDPSFPLFNDGLRIDRISSETRQTFTARAGGTAFVPLDEQLNVFFSGMLQAGYQPESETEALETLRNRDGDFVSEFTETTPSELSIGPDIAVGAQYIIFDNLAFDIRYRAIVFFPLSGQFDFEDARVNHGVNLGFSYRF